MGRSLLLALLPALGLVELGLNEYFARRAPGFDDYAALGRELSKLKAAREPVVVAPAWRGRGVGEAMMRLLLAHPAVRRVRRVYLGTRDAQRFYERLGFGDRNTLETKQKPYVSTEMVLVRPDQRAGS